MAKKNNEFVQDNGIVVKEGRYYLSHVGDLVKVKSIDVEKDEMRTYNISESCNSWHMISRAQKHNKFKKGV